MPYCPYSYILMNEPKCRNRIHIYTAILLFHLYILSHDYIPYSKQLDSKTSVDTQISFIGASYV